MEFLAFISRHCWSRRGGFGDDLLFLYHGIIPTGVEVLVTEYRIQAYTPRRNFLHVEAPSAESKGRHARIRAGHILASRSHDNARRAARYQ